ncbi:cupin domain-containing protein [Roseomonas sp. HF4]|uniref:cupin domain-containing protein n=1 Tax=Roseomonas sp. HF4 TaxID=2562313 RepID=UPI0010C009BC|nr:cupin domain-containing protein [Roseomonas sp. HF4]
MHEHRRDGAELLFLPDGGDIPNNPRLPVLLHRAAVPVGEPAAAEALFLANAWRPAWRGGIHAWHHYHSNAHEALAVVAGQVRVQLGGEQGVQVELAAGDVAVLPAGTGHRNLEASPDLQVVGAYPEGSDPPDQHHGAPEERARALHAIAATPDPATDPVTGGAYPLA